MEARGRGEINASLKIEFQAELDNPWGVELARNQTKRTGIKGCVGICQLRPVENIEELSAELRVKSFFKRNVLDEAPIKILNGITQAAQ